MRRVAVWGIALALAGVGASTQGTAEAAPPARGSSLTFHGWSADSRLIAYTRTRSGRGSRPRRDKDAGRGEQRMHRFVEGGRFAGFGRMVGGDVARYALENGYVATPAPHRRVAEMAFELSLGVEILALKIGLGRAQTWRLTRAGVILAEHTFDRIYVGFDVELYPSPDGKQAVLVMHLDTGWEIDAAIFPVSLVADGTTRRE